jgi:hypothetical protein
MGADPDADATQAVGRPSLTNTDRLQSHLKPKGLASALLKAWITASPSDRPAKLLAAIEAFNQQEEPPDGQAAAQ